jgi:AraC-like DNA-binding protein
MLEIAATIKLAVAGIALTWIAAIILMPKRQPLHVAWAVFCGGLTAVMLREVFGEALGPLTPVLLIASCGTCSVFWLVARSLFRSRAPVGPAQILIVAGIFAPAVIDQALMAAQAPAWMPPAELTGITDALYGFQGLLSSTVLVLAFWEGVRGWSSALPVNERRMRILYLATFGLCVSTCVMLLDHGQAPLPAEMMAGIQAACALAILAVVSVAVRYRTAHPLPDGTARPAPPARDEDRALGERLRELMATDRPYLDPELKVATLARRLREPEYRVSRAITAGLGEANFNRFVNRHRVEHARAMLADPACAGEPILNIALDSGFASLGPFNRAFKDMTGQTPRQYRLACGANGAPAPRGLAAE